MNTVRKNQSFFSKAVIVCSFLFFYFFLVSFVEAAGQYVPIVGIPGLTNQNTASLPDYINRIYFFTITIGALYGVVKIAFAGVKYSMSDIITSKESAKEDIKGVLLGLAILLIPFIVLKTINPELTRLDVLGSVKNKIQLTTSGSNNAPKGTVADSNDKASILRTKDFPAGTKLTTEGYKADTGAGGCWTEAQQNTSNCQSERNNLIKDCTSKGGTYTDLQNKQKGLENTGSIQCVFASNVDQIPK